MMKILDLTPRGHESRLIGDGGVLSPGSFDLIERSVDVGVSAPIGADVGDVFDGEGGDPSEGRGVLPHSRGLDVGFPEEEVVDGGVGGHFSPWGFVFAAAWGWVEDGLGLLGRWEEGLVAGWYFLVEEVMGECVGSS